MTTICYKDGVLAACHMAGHNGSFIGRVRKVFSVEGVLFGVAGECHFIERVRNRVKAFGSMDYDGFHEDLVDRLHDMIRDYNREEAPNVEVLVVESPDRVWSVDWYGVVEHLDVDVSGYATGSGREVAMGAMMWGATAVEAVVVAAKVDKHTMLCGAPDVVACNY